MSHEVSGEKVQERSTNQRIINAASKLFAEKGYVETTTRALASAANVSEATIFRNFGSKKELFRVVLLENTPGMENLLLDGLTNGKDLRRDLYLLFQEYTVTYIKHIPNYKLSVQMVDELYEDECYPEPVDRLENMRTQLLSYLNMLKAFGKIGDIDCTALSEFLFSTFMIKAPEFIRDNKMDDEYNAELVEQFVNECADYVYKLIAVEKVETDT